MKKHFDGTIRMGIAIVYLLLTLGVSEIQSANKPEGPVDLEADKGTFDLKAKAHHFQGNIRLTQSDFSVRADQAWVKGEPGKQTVRAQGSPVKVVWSSEHMQATASQVEYDQLKGELDLIGHVRLEQNGNSLEGEHIRYSLLTRAAMADGGKSTGPSQGRVKMRWVPEKTKESHPASAATGGL
jgi:lipopolysaccharide transport protein LptA